MLNIIIIISLLILMILFGIVAIFSVIGGNMNKSDYEKRIEDEEQMNDLKQKNK